MPSIRHSTKAKAMKFIILVTDGMADYPSAELDGRTPLQVARHPNIDHLLQRGVCGLVKTIPEDMEANTDVALLSVLGCNPREHYAGRGPLEAASMGIRLADDEVAFRFNLIEEENGILKDFTAGHIKTDKARILVESLSEAFGSDEVRFYPGVSYRHIMILKGYSDKVHCYPAHDVVGKPIQDLWVTPREPEGERTAELLNDLTRRSREILIDHPLNKEQKSSANMIWPWGPGKTPFFRTFNERYGLKTAVISAVDIVNGLGILMGMDVIKVPRATGFIDTNYEGKATYVLEALKTHDLVLLHVEAPDEVGHLGDAKLKVKTIEDLDRRLLGRLLEKIGGQYVITVLPDHFTSVTVKMHSADAVPFLVYCSEKPVTNQIRSFDEASVYKSGIVLERGYEFLDFFLGYGRS
ncbi:cofactor-independent phosphoglycerate mutase [Candidatus Bathyarchaeota archaeon]|nr:cofactor-independent phosphoglycerate mutase [Candidatus Bathyarchaeota archaeon]